MASPTREHQPPQLPQLPGTLVELWESSSSRHSRRALFGLRGEEGSFRWITYGELGQHIADLRGGLAALGVGPGQSVGVIAGNGPEWATVAFATYGLGARLVPMYEAELDGVWRYVIADSEVRVLLVATPAVRDRVQAMRGALPALAHLVLLRGDGPGTVAELERRGRAAPAPPVLPGPDDVAAVVYTSGTTGEPKGVLLSHRNFVSTVQAGRAAFPDLDRDSRCLSILPWAHVYSQSAELYTFISLGAAVAISGGRETVAADLAEVRPTHLIAVPRVLSRMHQAIRDAAEQAGGPRQRLLRAALAASRARRERGEARLQSWILDRLVLSRVRARFGGRLRAVLSASARIDFEIARFFFDLGIPVYDCYGLTETSPAVTMNRPAACKLGTVGRPVGEVRVSIDRSVTDESSTEGEIIVHGPNVMLGYHGKPDATAGVMTPDGGLRTGDRGYLDEEGYLHLTGRFKEQYKLANGKYVFPSSVEDQLLLVPYVASAMVYGEAQAYNVCLLALRLDLLDRVAKDAGVTLSGSELLRAGSALGRAGRELIRLDLLRQLQGRLAGYEIPRRFLFIAEPLTLENGMLTQTLKVRRQAVLERYKESLLALYRRDEDASAVED